MEPKRFALSVWQLFAAIAVVLLVGILVYRTNRARDFLTLCTASEGIHQLVEESYEIPVNVVDIEMSQELSIDLRILFDDFRASLPPDLADEGEEVVAYYSELSAAESKEDLQRIFDQGGQDFGRALKLLHEHALDQCSVELLPSPPE